jgi:6-phosphogluconolactonase
VASYQWDSDKGTARFICLCSTLPSDFKGDSFAADIHLHPNGRHLLGTNRGDNSLAIILVNPETGELKWQSTLKLSGIDWPRNFALYQN